MYPQADPFSIGDLTARREILAQARRERLDLEERTEIEISIFRWKDQWFKIDGVKVRNLFLNINLSRTPCEDKSGVSYFIFVRTFMKYY